MKSLGGIAMLMRKNTLPTSLLNTSTSNATPQNRFSDILDEFMEDALSWGSGRFVPELNVYETDKAFEVTLALPGISKDDIDISMEGHTLTISGERTFEEDESRKYHRVESRFGKFERSLPLPDIIDEDNIRANYENGVLTVTVPKLKEKAGRKIEVH